eukprot:6145013-Amphidinium_carterae.1
MAKVDALSDPTVAARRQRRASAAKKASFACSVLSAQPLFQGCSTSFLEALVENAEAIEIGEGVPLEIDAEGPLYILEAGALEVRVGDGGDPVMVGPGMVFNTLGIVEFQADQQDQSFRATKSARKNSRAFA